MHLGLLLGSNKPKGIDTFLLQERNKSNRGQETFIPGKDSPNCNNEETRSSQLGGLRNLISVFSCSSPEAGEKAEHHA